MKSFHTVLSAFFFAAVVSTLVLVSGVMSQALADDVAFGPQTKIRVTIVQWIQSEGQYQRWDALGGDFTVSDEGAVSLPFLGALSVVKLDTVGLAGEISRRLQERIGLLQPPAVTVEVLEYPPVYVVGDVTTPGEYKFRPGLTVLQTLALSAGPRRATTAQQTQTIRLVGELRDNQHSLLRSGARVARLQAETAGAKEIDFDRLGDDDRQYAAGLFNEERAIFQTRLSALDRQSTALAELRDLLTAEIETLQQKLQGSDDNIKSVEGQLNSVRSQVEKGLTVTSRQLELERLLTTYRSDRLDFVTAIMRGRQAISETRRNLEGLYDTRRSEIASELQAEQARLDTLKLARETTQKLLVDQLASSGSPAIDIQQPPLTFTVSRRSGGEINVMPASETTALAPGDVVSVVQPRASGSSDQVSGNRPPEAWARADEASQ